MSVQYKHSFSELFDDAEAHVANLSNALNTLNAYLEAMFAAEGNGNRDSAVMATMRFVSEAHKESRRIVELLNRTQQTKPKYLE